MLLLQLCVQGVIDTGSVVDSLGTFQESKASDNAGLEERLEFLETEHQRLHGNGQVPKDYVAKLKVSDSLAAPTRRSQAKTNLLRTAHCPKSQRLRCDVFERWASSS